MILGTAILIGQVGGFVVLAFSSCGLWVKLRREEALLTKHLAEYSEYMRRAKALVPFVLCSGPQQAFYARLRPEQ
jgi:protein-S-isoprenylcysteine O-methyltransferase Ste14